MKKMNKMFVAMMATILALALAGCAMTGTWNPYPESGNRYVFQPKSDEDPDPGTGGDSPADPHPAENPGISVDSGSVAADPARMADAEAVAVLGTLQGTGRQNRFESHDIVDASDSHNPYDLVWQYGDRDLEGVKGFGSLYQSYVDAADWSLVFDVEYYKQAFPMLALQYHYDDALLLEHFQTVGVHEGRQASEGFNVQAYMSVCSDALVEAFGDNYECYYFYYMLNYDSEKSLDTAGDHSVHRIWLTLELTLAQESEFKAINNYREELGLDPLQTHPEAIAFANYRAWYNAVNCLAGHGWLDDDDNTDPVFDALDVDHISENTITLKGTGHMNSSLNPYHVDYANSPSHYEAMVDPSFVLSGTSHMYCNPDEGWVTQFDTFLREYPHPAFDR